MQIRLYPVFIIVLMALPTTSASERDLITWETKKLSSDFFGEGAYFGDFNKDGVVDVVSGPFWYEGPRYSEKHEYRPAKLSSMNPRAILTIS